MLLIYTYIYHYLKSKERCKLWPNKKSNVSDFN